MTIQASTYKTKQYDKAQAQGRKTTFKITQYLVQVITSSRTASAPKLLHLLDPNSPLTLYPTITKISPAVEVE